MASAVEAGIRPKPEQIERLRRAGVKELIIKEGIMHRFLRQWLPGVRVTGPGEALLRRPAVRKSLRPTDMYVIATRGYHSDFSRLVKVYDRLRRETGCATNLNLQRAAIPTGAVSLQARLGLNSIDAVEQARWILDGHSVERIVVEALEDRKPFEQASRLPVVHISELAPEKEE